MTQVKECDIEKAAREWVSSEEGQRSIAASLERAREMAERFREAERVDWQFLYRPMDI